LLLESDSNQPGKILPIEIHLPAEIQQPTKMPPPTEIHMPAEIHLSTYCFAIRNNQFIFRPLQFPKKRKKTKKKKKRRFVPKNAFFLDIIFFLF